jgi:hypothetical protein
MLALSGGGGGGGGVPFGFVTVTQEKKLPDRLLSLSCVLGS